jgi:hypothetical protein
MVSSPPSQLACGSSSDSLSDAEKGMYDSSLELMAPPPFAYVAHKRDLHITTELAPVSPVHEGITPFSSVPQLSLSLPAASRTKIAVDADKLEAVVKKPPPPKAKVSRWILADLWFNTYRKFFTFVTLFNLTGIILAALGRFPYAENHLGAIVLGNLLTAILFRNELWMRFLYIVAIYGLRSVRMPSTTIEMIADEGLTSGHLSGSSMQQHLFCSMWEASIRVVHCLVLGMLTHVQWKGGEADIQQAGLSTR